MDPEQLQKMLQDQLDKSARGEHTDALGGFGGLLGGFSLWTLFFGFAAGVFGWFIFKHGKKKQNLGLIAIGIAMMVYPYFVYNPWLCGLTGAVLGYGAYRIWER
jgi:hypothetical protein